MRDNKGQHSPFSETLVGPFRHFVKQFYISLPDIDTQREMFRAVDEANQFHISAPDHFSCSDLVLRDLISK